MVFTTSELRAIRAVFAEPQKSLFPVPSGRDELDGPSLPTAACEPLSSPWVDLDDFVETDWSPSDEQPQIWLIPCGFCPRFTYLKRVPAPRDSEIPEDSSGHSRFGQEDTHTCLQGKEDCVFLFSCCALPCCMHATNTNNLHTAVHEIQIHFANERLLVLQDEYHRATSEAVATSRTTSYSSSGTGASPGQHSVSDLFRTPGT